MALKPRHILLAATAAGLLLLPGHLPACGPFFPDAIFTYRGHPQFPPDRYLRGDLGVVRPTYARRYLVAAWRQLSGLPLTPLEQQGAMPPGSNPTPSAPWVQIGSRSYPAPVGEWFKTRARVRPNQPPPDLQFERLIPGSQWQQFPNCGEDAFSTAASTLDSRLKSVSVPRALESWVAAQDAVFSNCGATGLMPPPPEPGLPELLVADRAYQIAAAHFYRTEFDTARQGFLEIAASGSSPWRWIAPYLAARCLIRQATLRAEPDMTMLAQAERELQAAASDPARPDLHAPAERLLAYLSLRLHPQERLVELSQALSDPANEKAFAQNLVDYEYLMDRSTPLPDGRESDLTVWISHFQILSKQETDESIARWRAKRSLPWLVAAVSKVAPGDAATRELEAAAAQIAPDSAAWPTALYHRTRLLLDAGDRDGARRMLDANMAVLRRDLQPDSLNLFVSWRMGLAQNLEDFLRFAPRRPAGIEWSDSHGQPPPELFDKDAAHVLNEGLPLAALAEAAGSETLPPPVKNEVATAAWVRAVLLENQPAAEKLSGGVAALHPELAPYLKECAAAASPAARRFAAAWLFLHNPGLKPYVVPGLEWRVSYAGFGKPLRRTDALDAFRSNWWCAFVPGKMEDPALARTWQGQMPDQPPPAGPEPAPFLTAEEKARFLSEWERLSKLDTAPNYLGSVVVEWVRQHPGDSRAPEALHLAVRATRYGCANAETGKVSKAAFDLLHAKYPDSRWAKETKYWFK